MQDTMSRNKKHTSNKKRLIRPRGMFHIVGCIISFATLITYAYSCTYVPVLENSEDYISAVLSFKFNWNKVPNGQVNSDSVKVIIKDCYNPIELSLNVAHDGSVDSTRLLYGEYDGFAYTMSEEFSISEQLHASISNMSEDQIEEIKGGINVDFNGNYAYLTNAQKLNVGRSHEIATASWDGLFEFDMYSLIQTIDFEIQLQVEDGISVEKVVGEIAGVSNKVNIQNGEISDSRLGRIAFLMYPAPSINISNYSNYNAHINSCSYNNTHINNYSNDNVGDLYRSDNESYNIVGSINCLGLFPPMNEGIYAGNGVLRVAVFTRIDNQSKIFHAGINLYNIMKKKALLKSVQVPEVNSEFSGYGISSNKASIKIESPLKITATSIAPEESQGENTDKWFDGEKIDIEI